MQVTLINVAERAVELVTPEFRSRVEQEITAYAEANGMTVRRATTHYAKAERLQVLKATRQPLSAEALHRAITAVGIELADRTKPRRTRRAR